MKGIQLTLVGMALLVGSMTVMAADVNITASFVPSMSNPENNTFTNTTPQGGYCASWPQYCAEGVFSIVLPITLARQYVMTASSPQRDAAMFGLPSSYRNVSVQNQTTGEMKNIKWRVSAFSARAMPRPSGFSTAFLYAPSPCTSSGLAVGNASFYSFLWYVPVNSYDVNCTKIPITDTTEPSTFDELSIGYELIAPSPLELNSGIYKGTLTLSIGANGDFDFGDNFAPSDTTMVINFTLNVNHELKVSMAASELDISLQPCAPLKVCSESQGSINWEHWMVSRITPTLTGRSNFLLSSSGTFSVYLQCEQQNGSDCALRSDNEPTQTIPVQTLLTLPVNVVDKDTNASVSARRLLPGRDFTQNVFISQSFGENNPGRIDFLIDQKDVDTMLENRPDTYRGAVTVIFDSQIY